MKFLFILFTLLSPVAMAAEQLKAVQLYSQDELLNMIEHNTHLQRVVADKCQLVQDIQAQAHTLKIPAYQFLWGDMLAWGVCVKADPKLGLHYMKLAARQGLPPALEQLGRYYAQGKLVQQNKKDAVIFLREAASLGNLKAQMELVQLFIEGYGSPYDYEDAYRWLFQAVTSDKTTHRRIAHLLTSLAKLMHPQAVADARKVPVF